MPPLVSIVGRSESGKTTLLEGLLAELKRRGRRVATIKHDVHGFDIDRPGKDSWRHAQAGAEAVLLSSPQRLALIKKTDHDWGLDEIGRYLGPEYDLVLTEGYKQGPAPKVEVHRQTLGPELLCTPEELVAVVTDEPLSISVPQFAFEEVAALADLLEQTFLARPGEEAKLFVNGLPVPLNPFAQSFIIRTLGGMVTALKGVSEARSLEFFFKRP